MSRVDVVDHILLLIEEMDNKQRTVQMTEHMRDLLIAINKTPPDEITKLYTDIHKLRNTLTK